MCGSKGLYNRSIRADEMKSNCLLDLNIECTKTEPLVKKLVPLQRTCFKKEGIRREEIDEKEYQKWHIGPCRLFLTESPLDY